MATVPSCPDDTRVAEVLDVFLDIFCGVDGGIGFCRIRAYLEQLAKEDRESRSSCIGKENPAGEIIKRVEAVARLFKAFSEGKVAKKRAQNA